MNEWPLHLFSSLLFKPAYRSPLWKGSSVITLNKTSIPLSNEKRTRLFSSSLKSAIQSQCGALKKLNPLRLKRIDQEFDLGSARSDPCLLNSCTPGYVCWENPMILPFGREGRKKANTHNPWNEGYSGLSRMCLFGRFSAFGSSGFFLDFLQLLMTVKAWSSSMNVFLLPCAFKGISVILLPLWWSAVTDLFPAMGNLLRFGHVRDAMYRDLWRYPLSRDNNPSLNSTSGDSDCALAIESFIRISISALMLTPTLFASLQSWRNLLLKHLLLYNGPLNISQWTTITTQQTLVDHALIATLPFLAKGTKIWTSRLGP